MIHSLTGWVHTLAACCAMVTGMVIFRSPKATPLHRVLGRIYSLAMIVLLITAFSIYHLTKSFNLLHGFAVIATVPLGVGLAAVLSKSPAQSWVTSHYYWMCWSYIGLLAAFVAEISTRIIMPYLVSRGFESMGYFWALVGVATTTVTLLGALVVRRNVRLVATFQARSVANE